jgi:hypothetical protein
MKEAEREGALLMLARMELQARMDEAPAASPLADPRGGRLMPRGRALPARQAKAVAKLRASRLSSGDYYRVVHSATLREKINPKSKKVGALEFGEVVEVTKHRNLEDGRVRVRVRGQGWTSLVARNGESLLVLALEDPEAVFGGKWIDHAVC